MPELPAAAVLNFAPGQARANSAIPPLGSSGQVALVCTMAPAGTADLVIDVVGYFQ
jgi:hypothetical protein